MVMVDSRLMVDFCLDGVIEAQYSKRQVTRMVRICEDEIFVGRFFEKIGIRSCFSFGCSVGIAIFFSGESHTLRDWQKIGAVDTVDGRNPANQIGMVNIPLSIGFIHPRWLFGISSINRITTAVSPHKFLCSRARNLINRALRVTFLENSGAHLLGFGGGGDATPGRGGAKNGYKNPMLPLAVINGGVKLRLNMREWHLLAGR